ncbi:ribose-phosphate diphosphokinase [Euryarchaeota archaeon ex4484_162]|nr:MAG: ribose-phosphate diphosphokinase [Euryarchaeota archaeon ex4484_162]RLF29283.1 MAG: ribose-phosphate diphosphokinase [Thermoplasmata archaeon]
MGRYILSGSASKTVAKDLSKQLGWPLVKTEIKRFPDNELYIRILDEIEDEDIVVVQNTYPDNNIIELLLLQDALSEAGANTITVVIPYFGYSRQDKKFNKGEPISARAIAEHISLHASKTIIIDPHKKHILDFFRIPAVSCTAVSEIAEYIKNKKNSNIDLVLAPDKGALERAQMASNIIDCEYDYMEKTRISDHIVEIKPKNLNVKKKKILIIDDIISTGGTMAKSIKELKRQGAEKIYVACTHGLFIGNAVEKLLSAGCDEIISTDTIHSKFSKVKIASCVAKILEEKLLD